MTPTRPIHPDFQALLDAKDPHVIALIKEAIAFAIKDMDKPSKSVAKTISKIKKS